MASITLQLPDEFYAELNDTANQLKSTPEQCLELALAHFMQSHALMSAIEAIARMEDNEPLVDFPELKEELELDIKFHPMAMDELESLTEEEQVTVLEDLINRISGENEEMDDSLDLVIKDTPDYQVILSEFSFGQVVYKISDVITIYFVGIIEDEDDETEEEEEDEEVRAD